MEQDAEIAAMSAVAKALEPLEEGVRRCVIGWAASRFGASIPGARVDADDDLRWEGSGPRSPISWFQSYLKRMCTAAGPPCL